MYSLNRQLSTNKTTINNLTIKELLHFQNLLNEFWEITLAMISYIF